MDDPVNPQSIEAPPLMSPPPGPFEKPITIDWAYWARRLLVCNPFFLCSAALLLFGVNRLSIDPNFFTADESNLFFNYTALQLYGFLVVGTAIILARRKIWYDSALLVVVEHGLVLVPFMLLSQAALLNRTLGLVLAVGAVAFTAMRALAIRRWYPQFNLPPRALALGAVLLFTNAALPLIYPRAVLMDTDDWATPNQLLWFVALPLLVAGANLLPKPKYYGGLNPERHWLPLFLYALWVTGTGAHFWSLGHVSNLPFALQHLGPAALVATWTMYRRLGDCLVVPTVIWQRTLLCAAFATPLVSFANPELFEVLVLMNAVAFALLLLRGAETTRSFARELIALSLPFAAFGLPEDVGRFVMPHFLRTQGPMLALSLLIVLCALRWFRARLGIAGAVAMTVIMTLVWPAAPLHVFVQTFALFLLTHSLAWRKETPGATFVRLVAGMIWSASAMLWVHDYSWRADVSVTSGALILLATWSAIWRVSEQRPAIIIAIAASAVSFCAPTEWMLRHGSAGLIALAASLALFGIGFTVAWTRHLWERAHRDVPH